MFNTETGLDRSTLTGPPADGCPFVSVIVPTYNRAHILPQLMSAMALQDYPVDRFELIVVDNDSSDDTEAVVAGWKGKLGCEIRFYRKENRGPAASRNHGAARARGEVLAFTDSDCLPASGWLTSGVKGFSGGVGIVCGPIEQTGNVGFLAAQLPDTTRDDGLYPTANLFLRREAFEAAGGFDERFGLFPWGSPVGGEDTDLAWRIRRIGYGAAFIKSAGTLHQGTAITFKSWLLRPATYQILPLMVRRVPELRQVHLWHRYFSGKDHLYFHLAWLGLGASAIAHQWVFAAVCLPWLSMVLPGVWARARRGRLDLAAGVLVLTVYRYTAVTLALALGSVRARRLVL